jgi:transposase-like protein
MCIDLTDPIFNDEAAAWKHFEAIRWPNGPVCPHCTSVDHADPIVGKTARRGLYRCRAVSCRGQFTATVGTVFERSHIPMHKWLLATHLMTSSKKGISAHQLYRNLGFGSYRTAWFMAHRIREAMGDDSHKAEGGLGGAGKAVEVDETYVGGKTKNRAFKDPSDKKTVDSLVEKDGRVASFHVPNVTAATVREVITTNVHRGSTLHTDEANVYPSVGKEYAGHKSVDHGRKEYSYYDRLSDTVVTINSAEGFYSIVKRGINGVYHSVSEAHLHRYLKEFDFRYNNRSKLGVEDTERAGKAIKGVEGKRLTYNQTAI